MRIVFAGTPEFARTALEGICEAGHDVALVLSQPDRPVGRGLRMEASPVKRYALEKAIPVMTPQGLSPSRFPDDYRAVLSAMREAAPELFVVAAFGMIVPQELLDVASGIGRGRDIRSVNIHASLLPRWRGAAPAARAIEAGDEEFGVTLMRMEAGLDTGGIIRTVRFPIGSEDTAETLTQKAAQAGTRLLVEALQRPGELEAVAQPQEGATYAAKLLKGESQADFALSAPEVERKIRAFTPFPGLKCSYGQTQIRLHHARVASGSGRPGEILDAGDAGLEIACGTGSIVADVLQRAGKPKMAAADFLRGFPMRKGEVLT